MANCKAGGESQGAGADGHLRGLRRQVLYAGLGGKAAESYDSKG